MEFSTIDLLIVVAYLIGIAVFGVKVAGKQSSTFDYFLGGKNIPWWAVCFAIVATETSTLTFISIPGIAYLTNLNFLQLTFGYLIGRILVAFIFLPKYVSGDLQTVYTFLYERFGKQARSAASFTFIFTRLFADGVRLFATAIPLSIIIKGWHSIGEIPIEHIYIYAIIIIGFITLIYTFLGGLRAVIWTDVIQMFIYLGGAITAVIILLNDISGSIGEIFSKVSSTGKLSLLNLNSGDSIKSFIQQPYNIIASIVGGTFLSMASHGTDQLIVQRLLALKTIKGGQKALILSGVIVIIQFAVFLMIGVLLFVYYHGNSLSDLGLIKADEIFPKFIIERVPVGISGIIIAGLLAAAMSTLSGSINSIASSTMLDIIKNRLKKAVLQQQELYYSRLISIMWAILLMVVAVFFIYSKSKFLVEVALSIASFTYGGLLGLFLLGTLFSSIKQFDAIIGFFCGILVMVFVYFFGNIAWTWYTVIGSVTTILVGVAINIFRSKLIQYSESGKLTCK